MKKPRIYVDTSVFGGVFDGEFVKASEKFFERLDKGGSSYCAPLFSHRELEFQTHCQFRQDHKIQCYKYAQWIWSNYHFVSLGGDCL